MQTRLTKIIIALIVSFCLAEACKKPADFENGYWRGVLKTESGAEIPFNFSVSGSAGKKRLDIINGNERFGVNEITLKNDSVLIQMPLFDSELRAELSGSELHGHWIKHLAGKDVKMEFTAVAGEKWRFFKADNKDEYNISGRWSAVFTSPDTTDTTVTVAEFKHTGSEVTGTFLTTTGDYRFLEGTVSGGKLFLSCFDGGHAYLFTAKLQNDSTLTDGKFYAGYSSVENWTAKKDEKAMLPDSYSLTALKPGIKSIKFSFPDLDSNIVSYPNDSFKNKVVIIQFMGSWCPNCMDETAYLSSFYNKYKSLGVEVIGLAYERTTDFERSKSNILRFKNRFNARYPMLVTGYTNDKKEVVRSLPMLNEFVAFPTTIIIDKKGEVYKIHTGFSGPGTGSHYTQFTAEFEKLINDLLSQQ